LIRIGRGLLGKRYGKLAVCLDSFDAAFREDRANCQFALPSRRAFHSSRASQHDMLNSSENVVRTQVTIYQ
jgi:hypothetical protein